MLGALAVVAQRLILDREVVRTQAAAARMIARVEVPIDRGEFDRLPGAGASIVMTSSASTGRCPSFISPPTSACGSWSAR